MTEDIADNPLEMEARTHRIDALEVRVSPSSFESGSAERCEQIVPLSGRNALRIAALGLLVMAMGGVVVWLTSPEPWPIRLGASLVWVPVVALGVFILGMAVLFQARRANWRLRVDGECVALDMLAADGRTIKHESVRIVDLERIIWLEGDADVAAGVRLRTRSGAGLFIPADAFDVARFWACARRRFPGLPAEGR